MVVADMEGSSPAKKRLRLSLKAARQKPSSSSTDTNNSSTEKPRSLSPKKSATDSTLSESTSGETLVSTESSSSCVTESTSASSYMTESTSEESCRDDSRVPAVASLENFGNTCFLNSVLQVLRYTPTFLENLAILYQDIQLSQRIKRRQKPGDNEDGVPSFGEENTRLCWTVVKSVYKVYKNLTLLEEKYEEVASNDVMSMAEKPIKVLQAVRDLNPMFKGYLQHDAQEFLRCFLCYLQDAEKEVQKFYCEMPNRFSPKPVVNPIMQNFLNAAKSKLKPLADVKNPEVKKASDVEMVKVNLFSGPEKNGAAVKSPCKPESVPRLADTASIVDNMPKIPLPSSVSSVVAETETVTDTAARDNGSETELAPKRRAKSAKGVRAKNNRSHPYDSPKIRAERKGKKSRKTVDRKEDDCDSEVPAGKKKSQPLITNVFAKTYENVHCRKKRLGMGGAVISKQFEEQFGESVDNKEMDDEDILSKNDVGKSNVLKIGAKIKSEVDSPSKQVVQSQSEPCLKKILELNGLLDNEEGKRSQSFQDAFKMFASVSDAGSTMSDSSDSDTDIIRQKKLAKLKHESPRKSPRKLGSTAFKSTVSQARSQSDSAVNAVKSKLVFSQSARTPASSKSLSSIKEDTTHHTSTWESTEVPEPELNGVVDGVKAEFVTDVNDVNSSTGSPCASNTALWPVVKLEKCDHVFENNMKSVSAMYATQRMTPVKRSQRCPKSDNYLRQRQMETIEDSEALQRALEEMLNSPVKSRSKFDLIERLFQGTMILRTRCLQCEGSKERQEDFHDINIPVRLEKVDSDDEDESQGGGDTPCSLLDLIEASTEVERLLEDNKYFCEECQCYVEAERSIHYDTMPDMLTLHLKRFSADTGNPGHVTKINDHIDIPLTLPCLRYKCPQTCLRPDHKYNLYGIVTHSGHSLISGHYLAYVRALPNRRSKPDPVKVSVAQSAACASNGADKQTATTDSKKVTVGLGKSTRQRKLPSRFDDTVMAETKVKTFEGAVSKSVKPDIQDALITSNLFETEWFECDDETVRVFEQSEFEELLSATGDHTLLGTPYLLFYHKATLS